MVTATTASAERWNGTNGDFLNAANWSRQYVPNAQTTAILPAGTYSVHLSSDAMVNSLQIGAGVALSLDGSRLQSVAASVNSGTLSLDESASYAGAGLTNRGTINSTGGTIASLANYGTVEVTSGFPQAQLIVQSSANLVNGVLTGGTWSAGPNSQIELDAADPITSLSGKTVVNLSGEYSILFVAQDYGVEKAVENLFSSLQNIGTGSSLNLSDMELDHDNNLDILGKLTLTNTTLGAANDVIKVDTIEKGGLLSGYGVVNNGLTINGTVRSDPDANSLGLTLTGHDTLTGTLSGTGRVGINGEIDVSGSGRITASDVDVAGTLVFQNAVTFSSDVTLEGTLQVNGSRLGLTGSSQIDGGTIQGAGYILNSGTLDSFGGTIYTALLNRGTVNASSSTLDVIGTVTGAGTFNLHERGTLEFGAAVSSTMHVALGGGELVLDDPHDFHGLLTGAASGSKIDLTGFNDATETLTYTNDANGLGGTLRVSDGHQVAMLHFNETVDLHGFSHMDEGSHKGSIISYTDFHSMAAG